MQSAPSQGAARWRGEERIVIGIDIGTTHTAVAYSYLYHSGPQVVKRVASWPGQAAQRYESKIPSIIWYNRHGRPQAFCAEARTPAIAARAEREQWCLAEQFKLHVHPPTMAAQHFVDLIPLPHGVSVEQIYADMLDYLFRHTRIFFEEKEFEMEGGGQIWRKMASQNAIDFVLSHPSGWTLQEQSMLRRATVKAGLIPDPQTAAERVHFVSEAEASVHYVMFHADLHTRLRPGIDFAVCDAGGSTIDTTLYTISSVTPTLALREMRDSACIQAGGIFVDQSASEYFQQRFYDGDLNPDEVSEYLETAKQKFITEVKPSFEDHTGDHLIALGDRQFSSPKLGIERGYMTLTGVEIEEFFKKWVDKIIESIKDQVRNHPVQYIILVGGFGESPYLRRRLRQAPAFRNIQFTIPDQSGGKAASEGSVFWFSKKSVVARATRSAFGVHVLVHCDEHSAQRVGRTLIRLVDGSTGVNGGWSEIVPKGHIIEDGEEVSRVYERIYDTPNPNVSHVKDRIYAYDPRLGDVGQPRWILGPFGEVLPGFQEVCSIDVDPSIMKSILRKVKKKKRSCFEKSESHWVLNYRIAFTFGSTELKAFIVWDDNGVTHRGPASIIPISRAVATRESALF